MALNRDNMRSFKQLSIDDQGRIEQVKAFFKLVEEFSKKKAYHYEIRQDNEECLNLVCRILFVIDGTHKMGLEFNKCDINFRDFEISNPSLTIRTNLNNMIDSILHNFDLGKHLRGKDRSEFDLAASLVNYIGDYLTSLSEDSSYNHPNTRH